MLDDNLFMFLETMEKDELLCIKVEEGEEGQGEQEKITMDNNNNVGNSLVLDMLKEVENAFTMKYDYDDYGGGSGGNEPACAVVKQSSFLKKKKKEECKKQQVKLAGPTSTSSVAALASVNQWCEKRRSVVRYHL